MFRFLGDTAVNVLGAVHWVMRTAVLGCHRRRRKLVVSLGESAGKGGSEVTVLFI